jgi:AraC-like DNA-binding protein
MARVSVNPVSGPSSPYLRFRKATISARRGPELDHVYGTGGGIGSVLEQFRYAGAGDADVSFRGASVEGTRAGTMQRRRDHIVFWIGDGTATITSAHGGTIVVPPGRPLFLSAGTVYDFTAATSRVTLLHLSDAILRTAVGAQDTAAVRDLLFEELARDEHALHRLRAVLDGSTAALTSADTSADARASLNERIVAAVLAAFPRRDVDPVAPTPVGRAIAFMHEHAHRELSVQEVAEAAGLSVRGLQDAFTRQLQTSPMNHLRALRLDGVHDDLASGCVDSISDVARAWQFHHQGRFASSYAARFGEKPSATLRWAKARRL